MSAVAWLIALALAAPAELPPVEIQG